MSIFDEEQQQVAGTLRPRGNIFDAPPSMEMGPINPLSQQEDSILSRLEEEERRKKEARKRLTTLAAQRGMTVEELRAMLREEGGPAPMDPEERAGKVGLQAAIAGPSIAAAGLATGLGAIPVGMATAKGLQESLESVNTGGEPVTAGHVLRGANEFGRRAQEEQPLPGWMNVLPLVGPANVLSGLLAASVAPAEGSVGEDLGRDLGEYRQEHPRESFGVELATNLATARPGFGRPGRRAADIFGGAVLGGGIEGVSQLFTGEFDPERLAGSTLAGGVFNVPWGPYARFSSVRGPGPKTNPSAYGKAMGTMQQQATDMEVAFAAGAAEAANEPRATLDIMGEPVSGDARAIPPVQPPPMPEVNLVPPWAEGGPVQAPQAPVPPPRRPPGVDVRGLRQDIAELYRGRTKGEDSVEGRLPAVMQGINESLAGQEATAPRPGAVIGEAKVSGRKPEPFFEIGREVGVDPETGQTYIRQIVEDGTRFEVHHYPDRIVVETIAAREIAELSDRARALAAAGDEAGAAKLRDEVAEIRKKVAGTGIGKGGREMQLRMAEERGVPLVSSRFDMIEKAAVKQWEEWSAKGIATFDEASGRYVTIPPQDRGRLPVVRRFADKADMEDWYASNSDQPWGAKVLAQSASGPSGEGRAATEAPVGAGGGAAGRAAAAEGQPGAAAPPAQRDVPGGAVESPGAGARPEAGGEADPLAGLRTSRQGGDRPEHAKGPRAKIVGQVVQRFEKLKIAAEKVAKFDASDWRIVAAAFGKKNFSRETVIEIRRAMGIDPMPETGPLPTKPTKTEPAAATSEGKPAKPDLRAAVHKIVEIGETYGPDSPEYNAALADAMEKMGLKDFMRAAATVVDEAIPKGDGGTFNMGFNPFAGRNPVPGSKKWAQGQEAKVMKQLLARRGVRDAKAAAKTLIELGTEPAAAQRAATQLFPTADDVLAGKATADHYEQDLTTPDGRLAATIAHSAKVSKPYGQTGPSKPAKAPPEMSVQLAKDVRAAKDNIAGLKHLSDAEKRDAQTALDEAMTPGGPRSLSRRQIDLLEAALGPKFAATLAQHRSTWGKARDVAMEAQAFHKQTVAGFDLGVPMRQAVHYTLSPYYWAKGAVGGDLIRMFRSWGSQAYHESVQDLINDPKHNPNIELQREIGLIRTDADGPMSKREDWAKSRWMSRVPVLRQVAKMANRASTDYLNLARVHMFNINAAVLMEHGYTPQRNPEMFRFLGEMANVFTGRGNLGAAERAVSAMNFALFSPHLTKARFDALNPFWYARMPEPVMAMALRDTLSMAAAGATLMGAAKIVGGDKVGVEGDIRSADGLKIRVGNQRFDVFGGHKQMLTLEAQMLSGLYDGLFKSEESGGGVPFKSLRKKPDGTYAYGNWVTPLGRFTRGHLSPTAALGYDLAEGANYFGKDIHLDAKEAWDRFGNFLFTDTLESVKEAGGLRGAYVAPMSALGVGVQTYSDPATVFEFRLRKGEPPQVVEPEMRQAVADGVIKKGTYENILKRVTVDKVTADFWGLQKLPDAEATYRNAPDEQKPFLKPLLEIKRLQDKEREITSRAVHLSESQKSELERLRLQKQGQYQVFMARHPGKEEEYGEFLGRGAR